MGTLPRRCLGCRALIPRGSYCRRCDVRSSHRWQRVRASVRADASECVDCGAVDDLTVDHVQPLSQGGAPYDPANLEVVCRRCNSARLPR